MTDYRISVIVPVYNVEEYLYSCLETLANQTMDEIEIIVIDDGSTDSSLEIAEKYGRNYDNFRIHSQKNAGVSAARNTGIELASAEYIGFVDSDDFVDPKLYEILYDLVISYNADIVKCGIRFFSDKTKQLLEYRLDHPELKVFHSKEELVKMSISKGINKAVWNGLYRKRLFENIQFPVGVEYEDYYTTPKLVAVCNKLVYSPQPLVYYRVRDLSKLRTMKKRSLVDKVRSLNAYKELLEDHQLLSSMDTVYDKVFYKRIIDYHHKMIKKYPKALSNGQSISSILGSDILDGVYKRNNLGWKNKLHLKIMSVSHYAFYIYDKLLNLITFSYLKKYFKKYDNENKEVKATEEEAEFLKKYA